MPKTSYITTHGTIWGEVSDNGTATSYGHDALGSVTETFSNGSLLNTYRYKPYGGTLAKTGTAPDPTFTWNGGSGYRNSTLAYCDHYVRNRHYSGIDSLWSSMDALWPEQAPYGYVAGNPVNNIDPTGNDLVCHSRSIDHSDDCPKMYVNWTVDWSLSGSSYAPGLIVQHVVSSYVVTDCNNRLLAQKGWNYFEAWSVTKGKGTSLNCANGCADTFGFEMQSVKCLKVTFNSTGTACFFPGRELASDWNHNCSCGNAEELPCRCSAPPYWKVGNSKVCVTRTLRYSMSCCGAENKCGSKFDQDVVSLNASGCGY